MANTGPKVLFGLLGYLIDIELEAGGRIQEYRLRRRLKSCEQILVHFNHGRRQLTRAHQGDGTFAVRHDTLPEFESRSLSI
jgi:hypothetical protein